MATASTCLVHRPVHGAYCDNGPPHGAHIYSSHNRPLHVVPHTTLASSPPDTTPGDVSSSPAVEVDLASQSISALNIIGAKDAMLHVTELPLPSPDLAIIEQPSSPQMETVEDSTAPTRLDVSAATPSPASAKHRTPKRKRTASPPSPSSTTSQHLRSTSRSTRRSAPPGSRPGSLHSHRRAVTTSSLTPSSQPSPSDPETRRQHLLALHRESCRLFQPNSLTRETERSAPSPSTSANATHNTRTPPRTVRTYSDLSTPPLSPILNSLPTTPAPRPHRTCSAFTQDSIPPSATIIDWTSPSTRRREYQKIDRASSGVRGLWRRVAPRWARFGGDRTPFFEQGKDGKGNYEGSVRRFRMDLPDEGPGERTGLKLKRKFVAGMGRGRGRSDSA